MPRTCMIEQLCVCNSCSSHACVRKAMCMCMCMHEHESRVKCIRVKCGVYVQVLSQVRAQARTRQQPWRLLCSAALLRCFRATQATCGERRRCPLPAVMTCSCMDMHHESNMHIMIMNYDDESSGLKAREARGRGSGKER